MYGGNVHNQTKVASAVNQSWCGAAGLWLVHATQVFHIKIYRMMMRIIGC
jgi:hypothetical protein